MPFNTPMTVITLVLFPMILTPMVIIILKPVIALLMNTTS